MPASIDRNSDTRSTFEHIERNVWRPSTTGPAEYFTGTGRVDPLFSMPDPARATLGLVTFEPGATPAPRLSRPPEPGFPPR